MKSLEEINKNLAEFMGYKGATIHYKIMRDSTGLLIGDAYTSSLDAQIPVMLKLKKHMFIEVCRHGVDDYHWAFFRDGNIDEHCDTIPEASARALDAAIDELKS